MVKLTIDGADMEITSFGSFMIFVFVWLLIALVLTIIGLAMLFPFFLFYLIIDFIL